MRSRKIAPGRRHNRLLEHLMSRVKLARNEVVEKYSDRVNKADENFKAFLPETELSRKTEHRRRTQGKMDFYTIHIPYTYALASSAGSFFSSLFLARSPIFQYSGRHAESQDKAKAVEALISYQMTVGQNIPSLYIWLHEAVKFPYAVIGVDWEEEIDYVVEIEEVPEELEGVETGEIVEQVTELEIEGYKGNKLYPVRFNDFLPDPRVSIHDFQSGEFVAKELRIPFDELDEKAKQGIYVNVDRIKRRSKEPTNYQGSRAEQRPVTNLAGGTPNEKTKQTTPISAVRIIIKIVPREWGLMDSSNIQKWMFTIAEDNVIIQAVPLGLHHNKFPFHVCEYQIGNDEFLKQSLVELIQPMSDVMQFLFNTHFWNVKKALNDTLVVNTDLIVLSDLFEPKAGNIIRMKPGQGAVDPRLGVRQLNFADVTRGHINDIANLDVFAQKVTGIVDRIMGLPHDGGRKTATEVRTNSGFGAGRVKTTAEWIGATSFGPLASMLLQNSQQLYDEEQTLRIAGNLQNDLTDFTQVTPDTISGNFDYVPISGALPLDRLAQAEVYQQLVQVISSSPLLSQQYNVGAIIDFIFKTLGEHAIEGFKVQVSPDAQIQEQAQSGNIIPVGP